MLWWFVHYCSELVIECIKASDKNNNIVNFFFFLWSRFHTQLNSKRGVRSFFIHININGELNFLLTFFENCMQMLLMAVDNVCHSTIMASSDFPLFYLSFNYGRYTLIDFFIRFTHNTEKILYKFCVKSLIITIFMLWFWASNDTTPHIPRNHHENTKLIEKYIACSFYDIRRTFFKISLDNWTPIEEHQMKKIDVWPLLILFSCLFLLWQSIKNIKKKRMCRRKFYFPIIIIVVLVVVKGCWNRIETSWVFFSSIVQENDQKDIKINCTRHTCNEKNKRILLDFIFVFFVFSWKFHIRKRNVKIDFCEIFKRATSAVSLYHI